MIQNSLPRVILPWLWSIETGWCDVFPTGCTRKIKRGRVRYGFTLLELLIVLALLVMLMSMGFPSVHRMHVRNQLTSSAQQLQAELYRTRLEAMKNGKAYVFRYQYGSSLFEVLPKEVYDQREESKIGGGAVSAGAELLEEETSDTFSEPEEREFVDTATRQMIAGSYGIYEKQLSNGIVFLQATLPDRAGTPENDLMAPPPDFEDLENEDSSTERIPTGWSPPILFFPNGRTSQTSVLLQTTGLHHFRRQLFLRGLTGTARIVEIE